MPKKPDRGITYERDLYAPVKAYLETQQWDVKAEVSGCDVAALRDGKLLMAEMKLTLNLDVLLQASGRQAMADVVYIAVPKKSGAMRTQRWRDILSLLKRLNLGLLVVSVASGHADVEELIEPTIPDGGMQARGRAVYKRMTAMKELQGRSGDWNTGGVNKQKLVTAYREAALRLAARIAECGPMSARQLKTSDMSADRIWGIFNDNHYFWFRRVGKGLYDLTDEGRSGLQTYGEVVNSQDTSLIDDEVFAGTVVD